MRIRPILISTGLLAVAAVGGLWGNPLSRQEGAGSFVTLPARRGDLEVTVPASGVIEPVKLVSVGAQVSGRLLALNVGLGDQLKAGQLIGEIDSIPQANAVRKAKASLTSLKAQREGMRATLKQAELAYRRQADILSGRAGTRQDYEMAEAAYEGARASLANLDAMIEGASVDVGIAEANLVYTRIIAPIDGTVVAIITKQGQTVISAQSAPTIVKLADLNIMSVKAKVSEADVGRLKPGTPVVLTSFAQPERRYEARLRTIDPAPDQILTDTTGPGQTSSGGQGSEAAIYFNARFEIDNSDGLLRPLMSAQVIFVLDRVTQAVLIPRAALRQSSRDNGYVTVLDREGRPQEKAVRTGLSNSTDIQIVEGVEAGEAVVIAGPQNAETAMGPMRGGRL
ncbi:efflux RND transporter periplasmic adaptor subunit [Methylorubrum thiocyanatum]|uniref:efflux RND transporter periplasmic adaptor subunit n=1 Tax=Methylorubrum thiocyanatum TaxID=47958 RepID=UPI000ACC987E|nr:efflux RND transporter periplasmic adaptor subunit [Methylorubrum thiocyanatum]GJE81917.1 Macrolide export protein MacA [Methylorubrum thiocyanatum]